jgi:CRP/FNR family cyclic AMP-dependent transcriptional regulator
MAIETLERLLRAHPFLQELSDAHVSFLTSCAKNERFDPGRFIFHEGDPATALYLLRQGRVALEVHVPGRGATLVESLQGGDILGFSWMFAPHRWKLDALVIEPVIALSIDATCVREKMEREPAFGYALSKLLMRRLQQRLERVRKQRLDVYKREGA